MRFAVLHERNLHIEQSSFSQVVQPMYVYARLKKMRKEKTKKMLKRKMRETGLGRFRITLHHRLYISL